MRLHESGFSLELLTLLLCEVQSVHLSTELPKLKVAIEELTVALRLRRDLRIPVASLLSPVIRSINDLGDNTILLIYAPLDPSGYQHLSNCLGACTASKFYQTTGP